MDLPMAQPVSQHLQSPAPTHTIPLHRGQGLLDAVPKSALSRAKVEHPDSYGFCSRPLFSTTEEESLSTAQMTRQDLSLTLVKHSPSLTWARREGRDHSGLQRMQAEPGPAAGAHLVTWCLRWLLSTWEGDCCEDQQGMGGVCYALQLTF